MNRKEVIVRFGRKSQRFYSIRDAVEFLADIAGVYYSYPEKSGCTHLAELVERIPSATSFTVVKG